MEKRREVADLKAMVSAERRLALKKHANGLHISGTDSKNTNGNGKHSNGSHGSNGSNGRKKTHAASPSTNGHNGHTNGNGRHIAPLTTPLPPTRLSADDLEFFKQLLLDKRREILGDVTHMENEALGKNRSDAAGDLSMMPIHMADIGTDNYEQEFTLGLVAGERETLKEIDEALERIRNGTFGNCLATHKPIAKDRLKAKPWARHCIQYKRAQEENDRR